LFYEAVMAGVIVKEKAPGASGRRPDQNLSEALLWLREYPEDAPLVRWEEIQDRGRHVVDYTGVSSILEGTRDRVNRERLDPWRRHAPLLLVESESLAGLLDDLAYTYRVVLVPVRGQSAGFLVNDVLPYVERGSTRVLPLFDFDKAGDDIEDNARRRLERHAGLALDWTRIALTAAQVDAHQIPLVSRRDGRDGQVRLVAETEAMPQAVLMGLVEAALRGLCRHRSSAYMYGNAGSAPPCCAGWASKHRTAPGGP
jgi:hypothetical protein